MQPVSSGQELKKWNRNTREEVASNGAGLDAGWAAPIGYLTDNGNIVMTKLHSDTGGTASRRSFDAHHYTMTSNLHSPFYDGEYKIDCDVGIGLGSEI